MNTFQKIKSTKNIFTNINLVLNFINIYEPSKMMNFFFINIVQDISMFKLFFNDSVLSIKNIV